MYQDIIFKTQKLKNDNLDKIIEKYSCNLKNDKKNENPKKENHKKYQSIEQYEFITNNNNNKNKKILHKRLFCTQDNKSKINTFNKNLLIQKINKNDNLNNNKYNSLSNILKNKKMISSPVLDFNLNNNLDIITNIINTEYENENDIKTKNKNAIENNENINNNNVDDNILLNDEIEKIKNEIKLMENNNNILLNKLEEEKNKYISLSSFNNDENENMPNDIELNNILNEICNNFSVNSYDEIIPKLKEMIEYININIYEKNDKNKNRNDLILKLKELYISSNKINDNKDQITIKVLWRWIKNIINNYKSLLMEKEKKEEILKNLEKENIYKECCDELMDKYKVNNLEELNIFIEELIKRNNINRKRVEQLKKMLVNDNNNNNINNIRNNNENNFNKLLNKNFTQSNEDIKFNKNF